MNFRFMVVLLTLLIFNLTLSAQEWYEKVKFSGDLRTRLEYLKDDSFKNNNEVVERYRERIRFRIGASADLSEQLKVTARLTTGESPDPIGANQTLTSGFSKKGINLDLAYVDYNFSKDSPLKGLNISVGKMTTPFYKPGNSELVWDADLTPEGLCSSYKFSLNNNFSFKLFAGGFSVEERSKTADSGMLALEIISTYNPSEKLSFDLGISYYNYGNTKGNAPFYDASKNMGNSVSNAASPDTSIFYKEDFDLAEIGFETTYYFDFSPIKVFADYIKNIAAEEDLDTGYLFGLTIGRINGPNTWAFTYSYRKLEANATIGAFSDSELAGGGTDIKGSKIAVEYAIAKNWILGSNILIGNKKIETSSDKVNRIQFDINFKF